MSCEDSCWTWERRSAALERFTAAALSNVFTSSPIQASRSCRLLNCEDLPCFWYRACVHNTSLARQALTSQQISMPVVVALPLLGCIA